MAQFGEGRKIDLSSGFIDKLGIENKKGAYELFNSDSKVRYVGRSEVNLASRLKSHAREGRYKAFRYSVTSTKKQAFLEECMLYHGHIDSGNILVNKEHPKIPDDKDWKCPKKNCNTNQP